MAGLQRLPGFASTLSVTSFDPNVLADVPVTAEMVRGKALLVARRGAWSWASPVEFG